MPESYARQGFERHEILNMTKFEKDTGLIHEATNLTSSSADRVFDYQPPAPKAPPELIKSLVNDIRDAAASGPWTEREGADTFQVPLSLGE